MNKLQEATKVWTEEVLDYYKDTKNLTQVFARGHFAGWSEGSVLHLAKELSENAEKWPPFETK